MQVNFYADRGPIRVDLNLYRDYYKHVGSLSWLVPYLFWACRSYGRTRIYREDWLVDVTDKCFHI